MRGFVTDPNGRAGLRLADDLPEPEPAPNEFLLDVRAFAINHDELNLIRRRPEGWRPGQDAAGIVLRAGADGSGPPVGARVAAYLDGQGWAERVAVPVHRAAVLDDRVSFEQAATLPIAGLTALRALRAAGTVLGRQVLVIGATGGVGQFVVQLALASGAHVTAYVSRPGNRAKALELGAHRVITSLDEQGLGPFYAVLDGVGGPLAAQAVRQMAPRGTLIWYGNLGGAAELRLADFYGQAWNAHIVGFISPDPDETKGEDLAVLAALVANGQLAPRVGLTLEWKKTPDALDALSEGGIFGKAVLTLPVKASTR
jgi:NADPH2:quinone reductase